MLTLPHMPLQEPRITHTHQWERQTTCEFSEQTHSLPLKTSALPAHIKISLVYQSRTNGADETFFFAEIQVQRAAMWIGEFKTIKEITGTQSFVAINAIVYRRGESFRNVMKTAKWAEDR